MLKRVGFPILLLLLGASTVFGQITISGTIENSETGERLPLANIQIAGTFLGTISNEAGEFQIQVRSTPATLLIRYIGFHSKQLLITESSSASFKVLMEPAVVKLERLRVTGEDPAVAIMKEVIARKAIWRKLIRTFEADAYTRSVLENDTSIVSISESNSRFYWDREQGPKEIVNERRETSNIQDQTTFALVSLLPNLYDDDIEFMGFRLAGVTHPDAIKMYKFTYRGVRQIDNQRIFDIDVRPKSRLQSAFIGRISVLDSVFAVINMDLKPNESMIFPTPIQGLDLSIKQQFHNFDRNFWLPVDVYMTGNIKIGMVGLDFPLIKYTQLSRLSDYIINKPLPDTLYQNQKRIFESATVRRTDSLSYAFQIIPLTGDEKAAYERLDSTMTLNKAFKPRGFLAKMARLDVQMDDEEREDKEKSTLSKLFSNISPELRFNRVDALHAGLGLSIRPDKHWRFHAGGGYKTGPAAWYYHGGLEYSYGRRPRFTFSAAFSNDTDRRTVHQDYPHIFNSIITVLGFEDYYDYYWNEKLHLRTGLDLRFLNSNITLGLNFENHSSAEKHTDFDLLGRDYVQRDNPAVTEGKLRSIVLSVGMGENEITYGAIGQTGLAVQAEYSDLGLMASEFSFFRIEIAVDLHIPTIFRRRIFPNAFDIRVVGGLSTGDLPIQRLGAVHGRLGGFTPFGVFRSVPFRPVEGEEWLGLFWEHNFRTIPFELLGLHWVARQGLGIILHGAHGRTWISEATRASLTYPPPYDEWIHEIGVSLNGVLSVLRLDFTYRLDRPGFYFGFGLLRFL